MSITNEERIQAVIGISDNAIPTIKQSVVTEKRRVTRIVSAKQSEVKHEYLQSKEIPKDGQSQNAIAGSTVVFNQQNEEIPGIAELYHLKLTLKNEQNAGVTLPPAPLLIDTLQIDRGSEHIETITGTAMFHQFCLLASPAQLSAMVNKMNMNTSYAGTVEIGVGETIDYLIPFQCCFTQTEFPMFLAKGATKFTFKFKSTTDMMEAGAVSPTIITASLLVDYAKLMPEEIKSIETEARQFGRDWTFTSLIAQEESHQLTDGTALKFKLGNFLGQTPFGFFNVRATTTGTGNRTFANLLEGTYEVTTSSGGKLLGETPQKLNEVRYMKAPFQFPSQYISTLKIYPIFIARDPFEVLINGVHSGHLSMTTDRMIVIKPGTGWVQATDTVGVYFYMYNLLVLDKDLNLKTLNLPSE